MHKVDVFLIDSLGRGVAVLTQAPASEFDRFAADFADIRGSLTLNDR